MIVVLVRTDEGLTGLGEASLAGRGRGVLGILDHFRDLLLGQDPGKIEHWWSEMVRGTFWSTGQVIPDDEDAWTIHLCVVERQLREQEQAE